MSRKITTTLVLSIALQWVSLPVEEIQARHPEAANPDLPILVDDYAYQLQGYAKGLKRVAESRFDLVVIDYSRFGDAGSEFTKEQIEALKFDGPCGRRIVLSYMSIGEAETFRFYFDPDWIDEDGNPVPGVAPAFLGPSNPDYPDNYKVRFWMKSWKVIIYGVGQGSEKSYLDRIIDAGFDGVYLDIIDAFEFWGPDEIDGNDVNRRAPKDMVSFVRQIARYARRQRGQKDFLVFPQNGANIIDPEVYVDATDPDREARKQRKRYFKNISGIGAEDTFFFGNRANNNKYKPQQEIIAFLDQFLAAGKTVLAVDYLTRAKSIARSYDEARAQGYVPYVTKRNLNRLTISKGFEPTCS
ncbi:MAG: MJ1477/TM1410 family putative glycoside hydrolase [Acidobacteriota bacterium]